MDWKNGGPNLTQNYSALVSSIRARDDDLAKSFNGTGSNFPDQAFRFNSANDKFEIYSSTSAEWNPAASIFEITASAANNLAGYSGGEYVRSSTINVLSTAAVGGFGVIRAAASSEVAAGATLKAAVTPATLNQAMGAVFTIYKTDTVTTFASDTTLADVSGLSLSNLPVGYYALEAYLYFTDVGGGGAKAQFVESNMVNYGHTCILANSNSAITDWTNGTFNGTVATGPGSLALFGGGVQVSNATNSIKIQAAQNASNANGLEISQGSWMKLTRMEPSS